MRVLISGATGFIGRSVVAAYREAGGEVVTIGRSAHPDVGSAPSSHIASHLRQRPDLAALQPFDQVVHLAGKAHIVPRTAEEAADFDAVNYLGTKYLLEALAQQDQLPASFVFASTVAVYGMASGALLGEETATKPTTPYGKSKRAAEELVREWSAKNNVNGLILRLPLVAGPNPPGNLGAMEAAFRRRRYVRIGGNEARKSMIWSKDLAAWLPTTKTFSGTYNLTDGDHPSFSELEWVYASAFGGPRLTVPRTILSVGATFGDLLQKVTGRSPLTTERLTKLTSTLTFADDRARQDINWAGTSVLKHLEKQLAIDY